MTIKERAEKYCEYRTELTGVRLSLRSFTLTAGLSNGYFTDARQSIGSDLLEKISETYPDLNTLWLERGVGEMLNNTDDANILKEPTYGIAKRDSYKLVPLYNWDAVAGMHRFPEVVDMLQYAEMMIPFLGARTDDISIRISNDSMAPIYMPGSIILIREVKRWQEYFGYGGVFVILLEDGRRLFKKILKHDSNPSEYVICSSENKAYPDEELPRSLICKVFKLIRCLTDEDF